jgi:hypothetical protein
MHPVKCICKKTEKKNGFHSVYIQYCYSPQKRTLLSTGIDIPFQYWDKTRCRIASKLPPEFGDVLQLNKRIRGMITVIKDLSTWPITGNFIRWNL